jgi:putative transposase
VSLATSPSAMKPYGILRVCRAWRLARATVQRRKAHADGAPRVPAKRGPKAFLSDDELLVEIRAVLASNLFVGEGHRKVWARLRHERGVRTSMRRVLRIMREHGILAQDRPTGVRGPDTHDRTITTAKPDEMWAIDATGCLTDEGNAAVFAAVDHCTGECLGVRAARRGTRFEAIECLREAIHFTKGRYADKIAKDTKLRHDHGSQFISHAFQDELKTLGIESSPSFVRQPEGNGCPVFQDWATHPHPEGAAALAAPIPHPRGTQPGAPRLRPPLQQPLDHRADRLPNARSAPTHPPRGGRVNTNFNLSQKLDAVEALLRRVSSIGTKVGQALARSGSP